MLELFQTSIFRLISALSAYALAVLSVTGCHEDNDARHYISVHELRIHHEKYIGKKIVMRGYLSGWNSASVGAPYLFATSDDAKMRNGAASVFIDLYENPWTKDISKCKEAFVQVSGIFRETENPNNSGFAIADVDALWIIGDQASIWMLPTEDVQEDAYCVKVLDSEPES